MIVVQQKIVGGLSAAAEQLRIMAEIQFINSCFISVGY